MLSITPWSWDRKNIKKCLWFIYYFTLEYNFWKSCLPYVFRVWQLEFEKIWQTKCLATLHMTGLFTPGFPIAKRDVFFQFYFKNPQWHLHFDLKNLFSEVIQKWSLPTEREHEKNWVKLVEIIKCIYLFKTRKARIVHLTIAINIHQWIKQNILGGGVPDKIWKCPVNLLNSVLSTGHDVRFFSLPLLPSLKDVKYFPISSKCW